MITNCNWIKSSSRFWLFVSLAGAMTLWVGAAVTAQQPTGQAKKSDQNDSRTLEHGRMRVFPLKHSDANQVQNVLSQVFSGTDGIVVVANKQTNSVLVRTTTDSDLLDAVAKVLEKLDVPAESHNVARETRIFKLKNLALNEVLTQQLRIAISPQGRIATDPGRNAVVAQDSPEALDTLEAIIRQLEENAADASRSNRTGMQLRIVWLVSGVPDEKLPAPPDDLKATITQLAKAGIQGLRLAAQTLVTTQDNHEFRIYCSPTLVNPCELEIQGEVSTGRKDASSLHITLSARERSPGEMRRLCNLDTTVAAPLGHTVVLGAAPIDNMTSVFVIQLMASE